MFDIVKCSEAAKAASYTLAQLSTNEKNSVLRHIAEKLVDNTAYILEENNKDCEIAKKNGMSDTMLDRLALTAERVKSISDGVLQVADLPDPIGEIQSFKKLPNGLKIGKQRVPLGTIGLYMSPDRM